MVDDLLVRRSNRGEMEDVDVGGVREQEGVSEVCERRSGGGEVIAWA